MKLRWTEQAASDLEAIRSYLEDEVGEPAAPVLRGIIERALQITAFPQAGRTVPEYQDEEIREVIQGPYRLVYRVLEKAVEILTVRHGRKPLPDAPPG